MDKERLLEKYNNLLDETCEAISNDGREELLKQWNSENPDQAGTKVVTKLTKRILIDSEYREIPLFEGHHLLQFAYFIAPTPRQEKNIPGFQRTTRKALDKALVNNGRTGGTDSIKNLSQETSMTTAYAKSIFKSIAESLGTDTLNIEALMLFFKFCLKEHRPIRGFDTEEVKTRVKEIDSLIQSMKLGASNSEGIVEDTQPKKNEHFPTTNSEKHWLSPFNDTFIPFIGRKTEMIELDAFIQGDPDKEPGFQLWAIVAPSGAGKTRLLVHWANNDANNVFEGWDVRSIKSNANDEVWGEWLPKQPTLICIDYIYGYDQVITEIITRAERLKFNFPHPVRLLLLDHATPDAMSDLLKDPRWGLEGEGLAPLEDRTFFKRAPLKLKVLDNDDTFLKKIICSVVYKGEENPFEHIDDPEIESGLEYFNEDETRSKGLVRQPLFAALVGDAIKTSKQNNDNSGAYKKLNRRSLMEQYLEDKKRLSWLRKDRDWGVLMACFVSASTALRGAKFNPLRDALPKKYKTIIDQHYGKFKSECRSIVSSDDEYELKAYEPDILGETHFLLYLDAVYKDFPSFANVLSTLISKQLNENTNNRAREFIAFITRLAQNLSNDVQDHSDTHHFWDLLSEFLTLNNTDFNDAFKWATSLACFELYLILKRKEQTERAELFLYQIIPDNLYNPPKKQIRLLDVWLAIHYFELIERKGASIPSSLIDLLTRWDNEEDRDYTALMLALFVKSSIIANHLIDQKVDVNTASKNGKWTALMIACRYDQEEVALALVKKEANLEARDNEGWTALIFACRHDQKEVALALVEKEANLEAKSNDGGTALMIACRYGQEKVALALVEKEANLEAWDNEGWTALMIVCRYDQREVALALVEKEANLEAKNNEDWTALMFACRYDQKEIALALVEKEANLEAKGNNDWTALMFACRHNQEEVALALVEKEANLEAKNNEDWTALMLACCNDQEAVALALINKNIEINCVNIAGQTILMGAVVSNLKNVVRALLEKGVSTDDIWEHQGIKYSALGLARGYGRHEIIEMFEAKDALEAPPRK